MDSGTVQATHPGYVCHCYYCLFVFRLQHIMQSRRHVVSGRKMQQQAAMLLHEGFTSLSLSQMHLPIVSSILLSYARMRLVYGELLHQFCRMSLVRPVFGVWGWHVIKASINMRAGKRQLICASCWYLPIVLVLHNSIEISNEDSSRRCTRLVLADIPDR